MQGHKQFTDKVVTRFHLSERVPKHNLYRRLSGLLDWAFLRQQTRPVYSHTGQPSLDPVVFFKFVLVGRLENIASDRRLVEHCALRLDILFFLGYEVDEDLPWHSTISRTRQLYPAAVFEHLFDHVFAQCVAAGLVAGDTQAVDSAPVKANASLRKVGRTSAGPNRSGAVWRAVECVTSAGNGRALTRTLATTHSPIPYETTILSLALAALTMASAAAQTATTRGYTKANGTYVAPYTHTQSNGTNTDNWSTQGNTNPQTGTSGTRAQGNSAPASNYGRGQPVQTGPRGGQYYVNDNGRKVYVPKR